ncbi:MAG TPA: zf-HC2 domain-containing protein, partial [Aminivibrio sp.]|nr:zf-HC2 domain-containing protein [Aminivibrio sp.]
MKCEQVREWMMDYLDGELPRKQERLVEEHLHSCEECHREFQEHQEVLDAVADNIEDPGEAYFASLYPRIMERIDAGEMLPWYRRWFMGTSSWVRWGASAVPVALALVLAVIYVIPAMMNNNVQTTVAEKKSNPVRFGITPGALIAQRTAQQVED